jgi:hypothetical protein
LVAKDLGGLPSGLSPKTFGRYRFGAFGELALTGKIPRESENATRAWILSHSGELVVAGDKEGQNTQVLASG